MFYHHFGKATNLQQLVIYFLRIRPGVVSHKEFGAWAISHRFPDPCVWPGIVTLIAGWSTLH